MIWHHTQPSPEIPANERAQKFNLAVQDARKIMKDYPCGNMIPELAAKASLENGISAKIVAADIVVESGCKIQAHSKAGALGLMQVMPEIYSISPRFLLNPVVNVRIGTIILAKNMRKYGKRNGLRRYFGISQGSDASERYATRVLNIAEER